MITNLMVTLLNVSMKLELGTFWKTVVVIPLAITVWIIIVKIIWLLEKIARKFNYQLVEDYDMNYMDKLQGKAKVKVQIISCMTVGPPTVGKTTLREQLLTDQYNNGPNQQHNRPLSTQVADKIKKFRLTANNNKWNHMTSDEELTGFVKGLDRKAKLNIVLITCAVMSLTLTIWVYLYKGFYDSKDIIVLIVYCTLTLYVVISITGGISLRLYKNIASKSVINAVMNENFKQILPVCSDTLIIHFRDSGGQPEFHEVIPALMPQSTLYLIMFNLNEDLEKEYNVTYKASEEDTSTGYESSFTVKETILQILASIQSLYNHTEPGVTSNALIIGTHKDKIKGTSQLRKIQQELEKEIKGTDWYTSDAITTTPNGDLLLPINTYDYYDVQLVKDTIKLSTAIRSYIVPVPFIALYFTIEKVNKPVMAFNEFKDHAHDCNITDELDNTIEYLQNIIGAIQYFRNIPEMKDIVITDPQILFNLVNELILCTLTFKNTRTMSSRSQAERFRLSGRFTKQSLQECNIIKRGLLTPDQVIAILIHLSIIAPVGINGKGYEEYFLPCVLVHAPVSVPVGTVAPGYSPLLVTFKCGYTPRGVFSCLISSILCSEEGQWVLASDKIYRNQVIFHLTECGHSILLKNCIKYLQVTITVCRGSAISDVPFLEIRKFLSQHLLSVITKLRYSAHKVGHSFGFYCTLEDHTTSDPHIAQCISNVQNPHIKCTMSPSPIIASLTPEQAIWFKGK